MNFVFRGGPPPKPCYLQGDATCDGWVNTRDIVTLVSYMYRHGGVCEFCAQVLIQEREFIVESDFMAMWYAGTLEPPADLAGRFKSDLHQIRTELTEADPALDGLFFAHPWQPSRISVAFDSTTAHAIRDSNYHAWDAFNLQYGLTSVSEQAWIEGHLYWFELQFSGLKNPTVLAAAYDGLPGMLWTSAGGRAGGYQHNVLPRVQGDSVFYLLMQGWGDCPSGCMHSRFYYVKGTSDSLTFVGRWPTRDDPFEPKPDWWPATCEHLRLIYGGPPCE